jgi:hypothetical protein
LINHISSIKDGGDFQFTAKASLVLQEFAAIQGPVGAVVVVAASTCILPFRFSMDFSTIPPRKGQNCRDRRADQGVLHGTLQLIRTGGATIRQRKGPSVSALIY